MNMTHKLKRIYFFVIYVVLCMSLTATAIAAEDSDDEIGTGLFNSKPKKLIALTFDDGPHYKYTPIILDALKKHKAKATFFVIGDRIKYTPEIIERMHKEGHEIGNHTFTHSELTNISVDRAKREIKKANDVIFEITKETPSLIRPPLGARNKRTDALIKEEGMSIILWNIDTQDWTGQSQNKIFNHIKKNAKAGDIILMHDICEYTAEAIDKIIETLKEDDFTLVTVKDLLSEKNELEPGIVYYSQKRKMKY